MKYRHYKGNYYWLEGIAQHTETEENLAIYKDSKGKTWARPLEMFEGYVTVAGNPVPVKRFEKVNK